MVRAHAQRLGIYVNSGLGEPVCNRKESQSNTEGVRERGRGGGEVVPWFVTRDKIKERNLSDIREGDCHPTTIQLAQVFIELQVFTELLHCYLYRSRMPVLQTQKCYTEPPACYILLWTAEAGARERIEDEVAAGK